MPGQAWQSGGTAYFVVRSATTRNILVIWPFATTCAYAGGPPGVHKNLYDSNQSGRLRRVSLDRPYDTFPFEDKRSRTVIAPFLLWDFLQGEGYTADLDAATSFDLEENANLLDGVDLVILVGHDEYLSKTMVERLQAHVAGGGNLAVFAANAVWWQVRFEGRLMVCYKNATEDPTTDETEVTANFASPPSEEENRLTGVSFRRGTAGPNPTTPASLGVVGTEFMGGVQGTTLGPAAMIDYETDGASHAFNGTKWMATGADGSPLDFEVLARVDLHADPARKPRGIPTLGWYTNVGVVFTAATTDWARHLADANVATVTRNVVSALKDRVAYPAWSRVTRPSPSATWSEAATLEGEVGAIACLFTGSLLFRSDAAVKGRELEAPASVTATTSVPDLPNMTCLGADLYARDLFAGTTQPSSGTAQVFTRTGVLDDAASWTSNIDRPPWAVEIDGDVKGIGGYSGVVVFANVQHPTTEVGRNATLVAKIWTPSGGAPVVRIARQYPPVTSITYADGMLYGLRDPANHDADPSDLMCREVVVARIVNEVMQVEYIPVDVTWTKIGAVPPATYAVAAAQGRLFALGGTSPTNPTLHWRNLRADAAFPYRHPRLLFASTGAYAIGTLTPGGNWQPTNEGTIPFSFTRVTRANDGLVFFYDGASGTARAVRFEQDGTLTIVGTQTGFGAWTHIVHIRATERAWNNISPVREKLLFYNATTPSLVYIGHLDPGTGSFVTDWAGGGFSLGWQHITCTHNGDVFFFKNGTYAHGRVDNDGTYFNKGGGGGLAPAWQSIVPAGHSYLWLEGGPSGNGALCEIHNGTFSVVHNYVALPWSGRAVGSPSGSVFVVDDAVGTAIVFGVSAYSDPARARVVLNTIPGFSVWEHIVALGGL